MQKLIDSISGIDLTAVQPEQLCRKHGTFRCNSTGLRPGQKVFLPPRRQYTHW